MTASASLAATILVVLLASLAIEAAAAQPARRRIAPMALPLRAAISALLVLFWLGVFGRPLLAGFAAVVTVGCLVGISIRKRQLVAEPLVFSDFGLLRMIVRNPELYYLGFMAEAWFIGAVLALGAALAVWLVLEPALVTGPARLALAGLAVVIALGAWFLAGRRAVAAPLRRAVPGPDLERDVGRWGLLLTLAAYGLRWRGDEADRESLESVVEDVSRPPHAEVAGGAGPRSTHDPCTSFEADLRSAPQDEEGGGHGGRAEAGASAPDLVIVLQLESFVDPVRHGLATVPLPGLARAQAAAVAQGPLGVPAHGAFTMRTEYAVLSGEGGRESGFRQFDPYLSRRGRVPATLATRLRARGYRTLFVHPFRPGFFNRDALVPRLGFDEALWEDDFAGAERVGPYVSDDAVVARVLFEARRSGGSPTLITAITMENHGPWPEGRLPDEPDATRQYLRHLANSDRALSRLIDGLADWPGRALVALYGDHPPVLPGIDQGRPPETVYAVLELGLLADGANRAGPAWPLSADGLGRLLAERALGAAGEDRSREEERSASGQPLAAPIEEGSAA